MCVAASSRPVGMSAARAASPHWCSGQLGGRPWEGREQRPEAGRETGQGGSQPGRRESSSISPPSPGGWPGRRPGSWPGVGGRMGARRGGRQEAGDRGQEAGGASAAMRESMGWHGGAGLGPNHPTRCTIHYSTLKDITILYIILVG